MKHNFKRTQQSWANKQQTKQPKTTRFVEMKESDYLKIINDAIIRDRKQTVNRLYAVFALALHDMHGFGTKRLQETLKKTSNHFECVLDGLVTEEEIFKEVEKYDIFIK